ncbi:MAG: lysylphosphatidylglycerol synthase transmembrane domain-containing protein, partial [Thermomicrobiales bacterium]
MVEQLRRRMLIGVLIGVVVVASVVIFSDAGALSRALRDFDWRLLPLVLTLTILNYVMRFIKWQYYLRLLGVTTLSGHDSLMIFLAGFTMVMTPGKVGELLKSYLVRQRAGVPMTRTAPVIFAERLSDGFALLVLSGVGLTVFRYGWQLLVVGACLSVVGLFVLQREAWIHAILRRLERTRLGRGRGKAMSELYDSTRALLRPRPLVTAISIGVISWLGECVAFFLVLVGLGIPTTWSVLMASIFVFAASTWIGGASMLPGGLGAAELSVAG